MLIIFTFLLIPSIFHVTTSKALNNNHNNNNSLTIININNSKQHDSTPSSILPVSGTMHTILQSVKSKLNINTNDNLKSEPPVSNRYRRNAIMEKSMYDPNYDLVFDDERNSSPPTSSTDWDDAILSRIRRNLIRRTPLSEEYSGMQILNSVNLSGRREQPFFVEEPQYISVRREAEYPELIETEPQSELFIPPRGRKSQRISKKSSLNNLFGGQNSDLFMPNRGKKMDAATDYYKRAKYNDLLFGEDLFFPNRGKKLFKRTKLAAPTSSVTQLLGTDDFFYPNRGKKNRFASILAPNELFYPNRGKRYSGATTDAYIGGGDLTDLDFFIPNRGKKTLLINKREILLNDKKQGNKSTTTTATPTNIINNNSKYKNNNNNNDNKGDRYKRDLLDNLSKEKDTFYSARGRRNKNNNNNNSINNNGERNNDNNNNNLNEKFMEGNNKNFLDDKFYTSKEILKRSLIQNFKNDYGITDDSRVKAFHFFKQIPTMYGMAGADKTPMTRLDQQYTKQDQEAILSSLINKDAGFGEGGRDMDTSTDFNRFILPRYFDYTDNNVQSNYKK